MRCPKSQAKAKKEAEQRARKTPGRSVGPKAVDGEDDDGDDKKVPDAVKASAAAANIPEPQATQKKEEPKAVAAPQEPKATAAPQEPKAATPQDLLQKPVEKPNKP